MASSFRPYLVETQQHDDHGRQAAYEFAKQRALLESASRNATLAVYLALIAGALLGAAVTLWVVS
jgi:hypothetical protein